MNALATLFSILGVLLRWALRGDDGGEAAGEAPRAGLLGRVLNP